MLAGPAYVLGQGKQAQPDLGNDPEGPLAPHDERYAIKTREVRDRATEPSYLAAREDELDPEDVLHHRTVPQRVRAARVRADVPADR